MNLLILTIALFSFATPILSQTSSYLAGMAKRDVTGPSVGVMFWGYGREDHTGLGIHTRQFARALVIQDQISKKLLAFVTAEVGGIPFEIQREVVKRLQSEVDPEFSYGNVLLNASHTHSGPGGHFHYSSVSFLSKEFYGESYAVLRDGIFESIKTAYLNRKSAILKVGKTIVKEAGINRSLPAYLSNPDSERKEYSDTIDREMVQLNVFVANKPIGFINWYGVHPTNITFDNRLISSDNKGIASLLSESEANEQGLNDFVAIFAQANEGDVSPNMNLNNTGPGKNIFESSFMIGERQFRASQVILKSEGKQLSGGISYTQKFIDMSQYPVSSEYSGTGKTETTCPSAYGYAFAAGSTEEGGGHWLFHEGMTNKDRKFYIDWLAKFMLQSPSDELRKCQSPKAILFPMGETKPIPSLPQILPYGLVILGDLSVLVLPHEVTTMSSRRLKKEVSSVLGTKVTEIVLSGLTNDFSGYITTPEEYMTQNYEGGHTLYGSQSLNALRQEYNSMSLVLKEGTQYTKSVATLQPLDLSDRVSSLPIPFANEVSKEPKKVIQPNANVYRLGEEVSCRVESANPNVGFPTVKSYVRVEKLDGSTWNSVRSDSDYDTKFIFQKSKLLGITEASLELIWETNSSAKIGEYRLVHEGLYLGKNGIKTPYKIECPSFRLEDGKK